jgi:CheY-like chemotaxis protein
VISGNVSDSEADTLRNLGVDRILSKPFTLAQLSEALDSADVKMG